MRDSQAFDIVQITFINNHSFQIIEHAIQIIWYWSSIRVIAALISLCVYIIPPVACAMYSEAANTWTIQQTSLWKYSETVFFNHDKFFLMGSYLRGELNLQLLCICTTLKSFCIYICKVNLWNRSSAELKRCPSMSQLKKQYKNTIMDFRRSKPALQPMKTHGVDIEVVTTH